MLHRNPKPFQPDKATTAALAILGFMAAGVQLAKGIEWWCRFHRDPKNGCK